MISVPSSLEDITPAWLTEVFCADRPGIEVTSIDLQSTILGSACKARFSLKYNQAGVEAGLPPSLVVKGGFTKDLGDDEIVKAWIPLMALLNASEARFYRDHAPSLVDMINIPTSYSAVTDDGSGQSILVLEDLANRGARFGAFDAPLEADAMAEVLTLLAHLHAGRWGKVSSAGLRDGMVEGGMLDAFLSEVNWDQQMARPRGQRVPMELRDQERVARAIRTAWGRKLEGVTTLLHGDPHIGNLFFNADGAPGLLDWQLCCEGRWAWDVVYSVAGAMTIDDRRKYERDLLGHYLDQLRAAGVDAPSFDKAWSEYRAFSMWGFIALLTPGEGVQSEEYNATVGERHAVAAVDLDAMHALGID